MGLLRVFLAVFSCLLFVHIDGKEQVSLQNKSFVIVFSSFNNKEWYKQNLDSVFSQSYNDYRVIYVDDASPDGTGVLVENYIHSMQQEHRVTLIRNDARVGALANIFHAAWLCTPNEIIVNLDGDDWLAHPHVLKHLNDAYENRDVWLTYGQYIYYPTYQMGIGEEIPHDVIKKNSFRTFTRGTTALRTFYAGLFQQIKKEDLLYN